MCYAERSSHRRCSVKKDFLKIFTNFTVKHLYWKLQETLTKVFYCEILRTPVLKNICERLLLYKQTYLKIWFWIQ